MSDVDPRWHESFFDDDWLAIALHTDGARTPAEVDFVVAQLAPEPGARILDVPCGYGRHAIELARRGFGVTGVDSSEAALAHARAHADAVAVEFMQGDMRALAFEAEFDGALNLFSSFGYFAAQDEDERVLSGIARALRAGGRFVLDVVNPTSLIARLRPQGFEELADGRVLLQETGYDVRTGRSMHAWTIVRPDGSRARRSYSIRMYTAPELEAMLERAGFRVVDLHGGFDGAELTRETWRLIVTAERRA